MTPSSRLPYRLAASLALVIVASAFSVSAFAAPKKKPAKPKPAESADTAAAATAAPATAPEPAPAPAPVEPAASKGAAATETTAPAVDITDTKEDPNIRYYFIGARYRGTIIPQFLESIFVDEGSTVYSNTFGVEFDMRKGGQSMIPWIVYTDYSMGDTLFHQKGTSTIPGNYSVVSSNLKALYLGIDELWSTHLDQGHHWDFEFGFGVGIGFVFGDLYNNWAFQDDTGPLHSSTSGLNYSKCTGVGPTGCNIGDHSSMMPPLKVNNYKEPNWFSGGSVPVIFPSISFPTLGIRYKPIKQLETRFQVGFSLTGFWFQLSADYGFEKPEDRTVKASSNLSRLHDML
ncbi:MAG: hypothetical protein M3O46_10395 [Myxococcota bacterium]|nr:hypothetical protein [Myxococcota bacterium]